MVQKVDTPVVRIVKIATVAALDLAFFVFTINEPRLGEVVQNNAWIVFIIWPVIVLYFWIKSTKRFLYPLIWLGFLGLVITLILLMFATFTGI